MGASGWSYFVPYQEDINAALQDLRWEVFRSGKYMTLPDVPLPSFKDFVPPDPDIWEVPEELETWKQMYEAAKRRHASKASSPDEALAKNDTEGTHSIIDIVSISSTTDRRQSGTLAGDEINELFGSERPTRGMIESKQDELQTLRGRWYCSYFVVYEGDTPKEIFFTGFSGD